MDTKLVLVFVGFKQIGACLREMRADEFVGVSSPMFVESAILIHVAAAVAVSLTAAPGTMEPAVVHLLGATPCSHVAKVHVMVNGCKGGHK